MAAHSAEKCLAPCCLFFCISMYFLMKVAARSAEKFKTLQFVVSILHKKVRFSKF